MNNTQTSDPMGRSFCREPFRRARRQVLLATAILVIPLVFSVGCSKERRLARHLHRAVQFHEAEQWAEAEIEYRNVLKLDANNHKALLGLADIQYGKGNVWTALPILLKCREVDPKNLEVRLRLAWIYISARQFRDARAEALEILRQEPAHLKAPLILADASRDQGEIKEAEGLLRNLNGRDGSSAVLCRALGSLSMRQTNFVAAEELFSRAQSIETNSAVLDLALLRSVKGDLAGAEAILRSAESHPSSDGGVQLMLAELLIRTGRREEARAILRKAAESDNHSAEACISLGRLAYLEGQFNQSWELVQKALDSKPQSVDALLLKTRLRLGKGETNEALAELKALQKAYPALGRTHYELALAKIRAGDLPEAAESLQTAMQLEPEFAESLLLLAELRLKQGNVPEAIRLLEGYRGKFPLTDQYFLLLAEALQSRGSYAEAAGACRDLLQAAPKHWQALFLLGRILTADGKLDEAAIALAQAAEKAPQSEIFFAALANLELRRGQPQTALVHVFKGLQAYPNSAKLTHLLARAQIAQGKREEAARTLQQVIRVHPGSTDCNVLLASLYMSAQEHDRAIQQLTQALDFSKGEDAGALMLLAAIHEAKGDYASAIQTYERLLASQQNFVPALINLSNLHITHSGDLHTAYALANRARMILPEDPSVGATLGGVLFRQKKYRQAVAVLEEFRGKHPSDPRLVEQQAFCYYMSGDETRASDLFNLALKSSTGPERRRIERCLEILTLNQTGEAEQISKLRAFLAEDPTDVTALIKLGSLLEKRGDLAGSKAAYETALQHSAESVPALVRLARLSFQRLGDPKSSLQFATKAREIAPNDPMTSYTLGQVALSSGDFSRAAGLMLEAIASGAAETEVRADLARAYFGSGNEAEAERLVREVSSGSTANTSNAARLVARAATLIRDPLAALRAKAEVSEMLEKNPDDTMVQMAWAAVLRGEANHYAEAKAYEALLQTVPAFVPAARRLAELCVRPLNDLQRAQALAEKIRKLLPEDPAAAAILGKVAFHRADFELAIDYFKECERREYADSEITQLREIAASRLRERESKASISQPLSHK